MAGDAAQLLEKLLAARGQRAFGLPLESHASKSSGLHDHHLAIMAECLVTAVLRAEKMNRFRAWWPRNQV